MSRITRVWRSGCLGKLAILTALFLLLSICGGLLASITPHDTTQVASAQPTPAAQPTNTPRPTMTPRATVTPRPTMPPAVARSNANLRAGPGTNFNIAGNVSAGDTLALVGISEDGEWYQLLFGEWIAAFLVDNADQDLPVMTPVPTVTPDPRSDIERCEQASVGVRYVITGSGVTGVSLTWQNDTGGINQGDYRLPICLVFYEFGLGAHLYISAQIIRPTSGAGNIICRIYDGDAVVAEATARGFAAIATCSGIR